MTTREATWQWLTASDPQFIPYIHFQNINWLKTAALFHDQIYRVIPEGYHIHDDPVVRALTDETDLIKIHTPTRDEAAIIGARFIRACESGAIDKIKLSGGATAHVHRDKLSFMVQEYLIQQNLARSQKRGSEWFAMSADAAAVYMGFLANEYAKQMHGTVTTDEANMLRALDLIQAEAAAPRYAPTEEIVYATFRRLRLRNPGQVDTRKIISFRNKYGNERARFFREIDNLANEIPSRASQGDLGAYLNEKSRLLEEQLTDLNKGARSLGLSTAFGACTAMFSNTLKGGTDLLHMILPAVGGASLGLLFGSVMQWRKEHDSPVAYLNRIQQDCGSGPRPRATGC